MFAFGYVECNKLSEYVATPMDQDDRTSQDAFDGFKFVDLNEMFYFTNMNCWNCLVSENTVTSKYIKKKK